MRPLPTVRTELRRRTLHMRHPSTSANGSHLKIGRHKAFVPTNRLVRTPALPPSRQALFESRVTKNCAPPHFETADHPKSKCRPESGTWPAPNPKKRGPVGCRRRTTTVET